ncbi:hypothetical protein [Bacteroides ovatus]|uniref:Uncharacterized protein n=1 Tax=Bacteroides ovatus TaxID=28116 RepID=A0A1G8D3E3_BACOV|nr:hypothetical protein [Bacteroides ovatus]SDH52211.1 hypothetical protein SAMN05192582_100767 [Bacteroides ovatus]
MKNCLYLTVGNFLSLLGLIVLLSCSDGDEDNMKSPVLGVPFKSIYVEVDQERVKAEVIDSKNLSLSFNTAENFAESKIEVELEDGYELIFPYDVNKADLANYPVLNFRSPDNQIQKYWLTIESRAFPVVDVSKIHVVNADVDVTLNSINRQITIAFDKHTMNMADVELQFAEGAMVEGSEIASSLHFDFSERLSQPLVIKQQNGLERTYTVDLNVATAMKDPKSMGFSDVTSNYLSTEQYPFISIYQATTIANVPILNNCDETPFSWITPYDPSMIGDWSESRQTETVSNTKFSVITIDKSKAKAQLKSNKEGRILMNQVHSLIAMSGKSVVEKTFLCIDGTLVSTKNSGDAGWRSSFGFNAEGEVFFGTTAICDNRLMKLPYFDSHPGDAYLENAVEWDGITSLACAHPWLIRNGRRMTSAEIINNDGTAWEVALGEAWNGNMRMRSYIGVTYDHKLALAVTSEGFGTNQGAWVLEQLGWKEVIYVGGSYYEANDFVTTLLVNGKVVQGNADQEVMYCVSVDAK